MIKAVFFDIDGTLLPLTDKSVPLSTIESLQKLRENGIKVIVATGRNMMEMEKLPLQDIVFDYYLTMNGQLTFDKDHNIVEAHPIHKEEMEVLEHIFDAKRIPFELISATKRYINYVDDLVIDVRSKTNGTVADIGEYNGEDIFQINAFVDHQKRMLLDDFLDDCDITAWNEYGIDIISKGGGKSVGIRHLIRRLGLTPEEVMAFGDGENDMQMLQYAGIGVAMGNARDRVKEAADYVTDDVDRDGIQKALIHFGLID